MFYFHAEPNGTSLSVSMNIHCIILCSSPHIFFFLLHPFSASSTRFGITFFLDCCDCNVKQAKAMIVVITIIIMMEDNDIAELTRKITVIISLRAHCMCAVTLNFLLTAYAISLTFASKLLGTFFGRIKCLPSFSACIYIFRYFVILHLSRHASTSLP